MAGDGGDLRETTIIVKGNTTNTANDATLNDDPDLTFSVKANERILFESILYYTALAGGIQISINGPAFAFLLFSVEIIDPTPGLVGFARASAYDTPAILAGASSGITKVCGYVVTTAAGNLVIRWAQQAANANNTTMSIGSWIKLSRVF